MILSVQIIYDAPSNGWRVDWTESDSPKSIRTEPLEATGAKNAALAQREAAKLLDVSLRTVMY